MFDKGGYIQGLSVHLSKPFNNSNDLWFTSSNKINGTPAKSWIMRYNINENTDKVYITDNFLLANLMKETIDVPIIAFQSISNSYMILKEIENKPIENVIFVIRLPQSNENLDYIIRRIVRDLIPLGYNIDTKYVKNYKDFFDKNFDVTYNIKKTA